MKNVLFAMCLSIASIVTAQTVNDIPIADIDSPYIELLGTTKFMSSKINISVQFGQASRLFANNDRVIRDAEGKSVEFNSMIDALNFFDGLGYEFVQAYVVTIGNQNVYHYLMKREESND